MIEIREPGWYADALPNRKHAFLVDGVRFTTSEGVRPLPGENVLQHRVFEFNGELLIAGQGHFSGIAWLWIRGGWEAHGQAFGISSCAFDQTTNELLVCRRKLHPEDPNSDLMVWARISLETGAEREVLLPTGSQGIRFVAWDGRVITAAASYNNPAHGLAGETDYGDVAFGETDLGCAVRFAYNEEGKPDGKRRLVEPGLNWFIRIGREHGLFSVAMNCRDTGKAVIGWFTAEELRALPLLVAEEPQPEPEEPEEPTPEPEPEPEPEPMPEPVLSLFDAMVIVWELYDEELGRSPDPECAGLVEAVQFGMSKEDARMEIRASDEWQENHTEPEPEPEPEPPPVPGPVPADLLTWPRFGLSYYDSLNDPRIDLPEFFARLADCGATTTRAWMESAWAFDQGGTGQYDGYVPWMFDQQTRRWDLEQVNPHWLNRLRTYVELANARNIVPILCGLTLYAFSWRKENALWVPNMNALWFRHNKQGVLYSGDDALMTWIGCDSGPHTFMEQWYRRIVDTLSGLVWHPEIGNEMPEKPLHERLLGLWRRAGYTGLVQVNRNDDTPGQYANMRIGQGAAGYGLIAYHGKDTLHYLDEEYPEEATANRPTTFRKFYNSGAFDSWRITIESDGCRKPIPEMADPTDAYYWGPLREVMQDARRRGFTSHHQSNMKMRGFMEGRVQLEDLEQAWMRSI